MSRQLLNKIDQLIEKYRQDHKGEAPLYIALSPEEAKAAMKEIKEENNHPDDYVITTYKNIKIAEHPSLLNGNAYVSNDLPETGS